MSTSQQSASGSTPGDTVMSSNQSPAVSEDAFLNLESKRPLRAASKRESGRPRPSDITITEPTMLNYRESMQQAENSGSLRQAAMTPRRSSSPFNTAASPSYRRASASPRHLSPATSQIFERDVQEATLAPELSPAIPAHLQTDDHIPAALEASSEVITNKGLDVDEVEVVTHTMHQPAAMTVAGSTLGEPHPTSHPSDSQLGIPIQESSEDTSSNYGTVDPLDPRRLSFISFADVVHGENVETGKEPASHLMSPASIGHAAGGARSPSPIRSIVSERPLSPPMSGSGSNHGHESSPSPRGAGSFSSTGAGHHSEITIQTMRETLEKAESNDMGGAAPATPV